MKSRQSPQPQSSLLAPKKSVSRCEKGEAKLSHKVSLQGGFGSDAHKPFVGARLHWSLESHGLAVTVCNSSEPGKANVLWLATCLCNLCMREGCYEVKGAQLHGMNIHVHLWDLPVYMCTHVDR